MTARPPDDLRDSLLLAGPTGVGKSAVALILAQRLNGEIVSADSMQVYHGLDIGTAKPSRDERAAVPHHLIDVVPCHEGFDAARYLTLAHEAIAAIRSRNRTPIICGGTGLYFKALLDGIGEAPPADPGLRAALEQVPVDRLLDELAAGDPATFHRIDRSNPRRVIRAIEILRLTGRPVGEQRAPWRGAAGESMAPSPIVVFGLRRQPEDLRTRIDARVDTMFAQGLVAETRRLAAIGLAGNPIAGQAIGYRQLLDADRSGQPLSETIALVKTKTRQYAKRQMTWFRGQLPMRWIDVGPADTAEAIAAQIIRRRTSPADP